jgi:serine protease
MTQYCEDIAAGADFCPGSAPHVGYPDGGALAGYWADTAAAAPPNASAAQLAAEAANAAAHFGNTTAASNRNAQYVIVSPTGTHPDGFNAGGGFCAWHDFISTSYGDLAFTNLPYVPDMGTSCGANFVNPGTSGMLDGVTMVEGHEYAETITDQNPEGGWLDSGGSENADKCAWLSTGTGRAQNLTFATGTFAMQGTWSNADRSCEIAHPIWGRPDGPDDFAIEASPRSAFAQPGDQVQTTILSARVSGNAQTIQLSVAGAPAGVTASLSTDALTTDDVAMLTVTTSGSTAYGSYPLTITAEGSVTHVATYTLVVGPAPTQLQPLIAATGLSGAAGSDQYFYVDLPGSYVRIEFTIGGGTGDADLFASVGTLPTDDDYECVSATEGNRETCFWFHSGGARWYLRVHGATSYSDLSIQASPVPIFGQPDNKHPYLLSGTAGSVQFLFVRPPAKGARKLTLTLSGMRSGTDVDLFVRHSALPTPFAYDCASVRRGSRAEKCVFNPASGGSYLIGVYGITDFTNVKLRSRYH